jgi:hypothetical protein
MIDEKRAREMKWCMDAIFGLTIRLSNLWKYKGEVSLEFRDAMQRGLLDAQRTVNEMRVKEEVLTK